MPTPSTTPSSTPRRVLDGDAVETLLKQQGVDDAEQAYVLEACNEGFDAIRDLSACPKLRTLNVNGNRLKDLRRLQGAPHLRELRAGNNRLEDADDVEFCKELETLHLHNNPGLEKAPRCLGKLRHLRTLRLDRCGLVDLGAGLKSCNALRVLDLSGNCISALSTALASLSGLVELDLSGNELKRIPQGALDGCRATLESLKLSDNELGASVIQEPSELVNGVQRKLRRLPAKKARKSGPLDGLQRFASLKTLHVAGNRFSSFAAFPLLSELNELDIARNRLESLEGLSTKCPAVDVLDASDNGIGDLGGLAGSLGALTHLAELRLKGNPCVPLQRPKSSRRPQSRSRPASRAGTKTPAWALVCARACTTLELLDDFQLKDGQAAPPSEKKPHPVRQVEPMADTDLRAEKFRALLQGARSTLRVMEQKEVALVAGGCKPPPQRPRPPSKDYGRENALAKKLSGLERALAFNKTKPEVEVTKPVLAPVTPPQAVDRAFAIDDDDESFLERRREAWAEEKVEELQIDSDSSDDEGVEQKTPVLVAPSPLRELPPDLQKTLDVFLTNTATPAQLKEAAETTAEALKACLTAGGLKEESDSDSVDDPEAFAIKAKYESAKVDYEAAMKSALDAKSGFGDSEDEDAAWPPDASGFMGTETPVASPPKPRKTTPPVARRPPKKKAAFVVPRRGSKDAVHL
jgi:Leucine-rich repeat (LRR) protein